MTKENEMPPSGDNCAALEELINRVNDTPLSLREFEALKTIRAALQSPSDRLHNDSITGTNWRHIKSGGMYTVLGMCRLEHNGCPACLYQGLDGVVWARDKDEFLDGRFEPLPTPPKQEGE